MRTERTFKLYLVAVLSCAVLVSMYGSGVWAEQNGRSQTLCPIMGGKIDKSAYVDYEGKRVYFCCPGCKASFLENPEKFIKGMESQGIVLDKAPEPGAEQKHEQGSDPEAGHSAMRHMTGHDHAGSMH